MASTEKQKNIKDFTEGPLLGRIILFTLPLIATGVLQLLFNTADTIVVGRWGGNTPEECETALAAVGSCGALINLIVSLFMGLSVGAGVCVAHAVGAREYDKLERIVHTSVIAAVVGGAVVSVFGFLAAEPLLVLMGTEPAVLSQAVPYMQAYFTGILPCLLYNYCAAMLRSTGDTVRPLIFLSAGGIANVILNLIMVLGFHQGALGVGIATSASQWVACIMIILFMRQKDNPCHIDFSKLRIDFKILKKIFLIGIPAGIQNSLFALSNVTIQSSINSLGKVVVAGNTAAQNLEGYIFQVQVAFSNTAVTFASQNMGARKTDRIKRSSLLCLACACVSILFVGGAILLFGEPLLSLYAPDNPVVIEKGMVRLSILALSYMLCGAMDILGGCIRGMGQSILPTVVSLIGVCAFRIVWVFTVFRMVPEHFKQQILYISYPISWLLTASVHFLVFCIILRKAKQRFAREAEEQLPILN